MSSYPNRQNGLPRYGGASKSSRANVSQRSGSPIMAILIGLCVIAAGGGILWGLKDRDRKRETERRVSAMLVSADQLVDSSQDEQAEALMREAMGLHPGDPRCQAVLDRISTKRDLFERKQANDSAYALEQARVTAETDIVGAIAAYERIREEKSLSGAARKQAAEQAASLKGGVCSMQLPAGWPPEALVSINGVECKIPPNGLIGGIVHGKRTITVSRFGYREPASLELEFRGLQAVKVPAVTWKLIGGKVKLASQPAGAQVWFNGSKLDKVTPCEIDDVDAGEVEYVLKHPDHADTVVKGEVKSRQVTRLSAELTPISNTVP